MHNLASSKSGLCFGPKWPTLAHLEHPEKGLSFKKEAERGWKSGGRSLSWKSGWKPWTRREFWRQRIYKISFRSRKTAVWKKSPGTKFSQIVNTYVSVHWAFGELFRWTLLIGHNTGAMQFGPLPIKNESWLLTNQYCFEGDRFPDFSSPNCDCFVPQYFVGFWTAPLIWISLITGEK